MSDNTDETIDMSEVRLLLEITDNVGPALTRNEYLELMRIYDSVIDRLLK